MPVSEVLKNFRGASYGAPKDSEGDDGEENSASRILKLSDDEIKSVAGAGPGQEVTMTVTGKLEGDHFHVMSIQAQGGPMGAPDQNADAQAVMAKMRGPMAQGMPS